MFCGAYSRISLAGPFYHLVAIINHRSGKWRWIMVIRNWPGKAKAMKYALCRTMITGVFLKGGFLTYNRMLKGEILSTSQAKYSAGIKVIRFIQLVSGRDLILLSENQFM